MIRLVAFDLDGTLMGHDQRISPHVRHALAQTQAQGVVVTLATGRMFSATVPFAERLNITAPLICYQGGWIQARASDVLHRVVLPKALARAALDLGEAEGWHAVLYADGQLFIRDRVYPEDFYASLLGPDVQIGIPWTELLDQYEADKVLFVAEAEQIPAIAMPLDHHFGKQAEVVQSHQMFIEIVPRSVNKGQALAWLANYFDVPQHQVLAAGDQENDLAMVQWAGTGVAMGNAIAKVKQAATWVAPPVTKDGVVSILERFVLQGE